MEVQSSAQFMIAKNLQELVMHHLPPNSSESQIQRVVGYLMRILSSRIVSLSTNSDSDLIKSMIMKKCKSNSLFSWEVCGFSDIKTSFQRCKEQRAPRRGTVWGTLEQVSEEQDSAEEYADSPRAIAIERGRQERASCRGSRLANR